MKTTKKIKENHKITEIFEVIDLPSSTYYDRRKGVVTDENKYGEIIDKLDTIVRNNSGYGSRKVKVELEEEYGLEVSRGVLLRLLRREGLNIVRNIRETSKSGYRKGIEEAGDQINLLAKMDTVELFDAVCTDFTVIKYGGGKKKAMFIPILGHQSKIIYGWALGENRSATLALKAWARSRETLQELGVCWEGMVMHHDRDSVFTGREWPDQVFLKDGLRPSYSRNGARENHVIESFNGHFKGEAESLFCAVRNLDELEQVVRDQVEYWNSERRHESLEYRTPEQHLRENWNQEEEKK